jgi:molecular chaperone DnaJ
MLWPTGAEDGMVFRIPGSGDAPISGKGRAGDLLVRVNVGRSTVFRRQGPHLYHDAKIPLHTAVLGGRVRIPTLDGEVDVRVPQGAQHGEEMVLKKRGIASKVSGYVDQGDLFVSFRVQLPRCVVEAFLRPTCLTPARGSSLTDRQRALFQQYADDVEGRATPASSSAPPPAPAQARTGSSSAKSSADHNGTTSTPPPSSQAEGGWLSRLRDAFRGLTGL